MLENMLDGTGRDMFSLLSYKKGSGKTVSNEFENLCKGIIIDKNDAHFVPFSSYPNGMLIKVNILDIYIAEL